MELNSSSRILQPILLLSTLLSLSLAQSTTSPSSSITSNTQTIFLTSTTQNTTAATPSSAYRPKGTDNAPNTLQGPDVADSFPSNPDQDPNPDSSPDDQNSGLLNYYFVFLALFVLLLFLGVYFIHKRKRARKTAFRNSGQNALARDMDGWTSSRRWMYGHRREESRVSCREEGLDEYGEAPPPYLHTAKTPQSEEGEVETLDIQIPLRTLPVHECERPPTGKPPGYGEALRDSTLGTVGEQAGILAPETGNAGPRP